MSREELITTYMDRAEMAEDVSASAPLADVYRAFVRDLQGLSGVGSSSRLMGTEEAGEILDLAPDTVADWCKMERLPGARKTGKNGETGEWRIPSRTVHAVAAGMDPEDI